MLCLYVDQEEKLIPRVELHRWIEESEKDRKDTMMDRKTLTRLLQKLQREGRVKCIFLSMPGLTNCGRSRQSEVVLLPEVQVGPDLLAKVHDRIRQFDMVNRGYGSLKVKADASSVPVLMGVKQIHKGGKRKFETTAETEAEKARTLSENGFVPAKMVRVRMLHTLLWSYVNGISEYADDELVMKPDESSCRVFSLALAVKAMPLDLFLQVVGSTKSSEELEPYSNKGLRLCDLPESESSSLLVSHANSRLSWLIDILRRLKLIRLVMGTGIPLGHSKAGFNRGSTYSLEASLIYAMEIQPYIEEPAPQPLSSLSLDAFDFTPRARHEFTLTSSESLEAYWQTLEYFFSGAVSTVARKAFPGTSVPELFGLRSWTSLRVMTSEQRKGLMKRVEEGGEDKRLSHAECLLLARELNLSPEQVLRVSYEKNRRYRLSQLGKENVDSSSGAPDNEFSRGHRIKPNIHAGSKKRAVTDADLMEVAHVRAYKRQRQLEQASAAKDASESKDLADAQLNSNKEGESNELREEEGEEDEEEDKGSEENPFNYLKTISKLKPTRSKRFPWSESLDRILLRCYARQRAILGARNHRVEWASIPNLPANPAACRRRTAQLKSDPAIRKALNNLCTVLSARYMRRPDDAPSISTLWRKNIESDVPEEARQPGTNKDTGDYQLESSTMNSEEELPWDSFEDISVAAALNEVMQLRNIAKAISSKRSTVFRTSVPKLTKTRKRPPAKVRTSLSSVVEDSTDPILGPVTTIDFVALPGGGQEAASLDQNGDNSTTTRGRSRAPRERKRKKPEKPVTLGEMTSEEMVRRSLGIANAVELVKLVLLNSASAEIPSEVVDALRRCEEAHVFAAFNYLRYQDYVIVGADGQPFVLSQKFFYNASASRFPFETGLEALGTTQWLAEHDPEIDEDWVPLPSENFCGQLIQLLGIVSEGEVAIAPFLPKEGVGESEDNKNVVLGTKRKTEGGQEIQFMKPKIQRSDSSLGFRRERGFPGVQVCVHRGTKAVGELVGAAVSLSQETTDLGDQLNEDMDWDSEQVMLSAAGDVTEWTETREIDVALSSAAGDISGSTAAREVDVVVPSATEDASESTDAMMVDVAESSVTGVSSEPAETTMVDVTVPLRVGNVSESVERTKVDVAMPSAALGLPISTVTPEVDVAVPSAVVHVSESKETAEVDAAMPSASGNVPESTEGNVALVGDDPVSKMVDCINHFCPTLEDSSDVGEAMHSKLEPELLEAATHAIEAAGNEGLSIPLLARILSRTGMNYTQMSFGFKA
jgi:general transcription factor 3C polypeptide 1